MKEEREENQLKRKKKAFDKKVKGMFENIFLFLNILSIFQYIFSKYISVMYVM